MLNDDTREGPSSVITACWGLALDHVERKVRPVAIREAIRRIAARVTCLQDSEATSEHPKTVMQLGVKVRGGMEYASAL